MSLFGPISSIPFFEYEGSNIGQVIEDYKSFKDSSCPIIFDEYWRKKVVGSMKKKESFNLTSHRNAFSRKLAKVIAKAIKINKISGKDYVIRECGFGNGLFALKFLKQLEKEVKNQGIPFNEIKYQLNDLPSVIDGVKKQNMFGGYEKNIIYLTLDDIGKQKPMVDILIMNFLVAAFPAPVIKIYPDKVLKENLTRLLYIGKKKFSEIELKELGQDIKAGKIFDLDKEIYKGIIAEVKEFPLKLNTIPPRFRPFIKKYLDQGIEVDFTIPTIGSKIIDQHMVDLKKNGYLLINDFGVINEPKMINYEFIPNVFKNSAFPINFPLLNSIYDNSQICNDKKLVSMLVAKNKSAFDKLSKAHRLDYEENAESDSKNKMRKISFMIANKVGDQARLLIEELANMDIDDDQILMEAAYFYYDLKDYEMAIKYAEKVIHLRESMQDKASAYYLIAQCYRLMNRMPEALTAIKKVFDEGISSAEVYDEQGRIHLGLGNVKQANADFVKSYEVKPSWSALINEFDCYLRSYQEQKGAKNLIGKMISEIDERFLGNPELKNMNGNLLRTPQDEVNELSKEIKQLKDRLHSLENHLPPVRV